MKKEISMFRTVAEYNQSVLLAADILTGKEFRRLKRAGKIPFRY